MAGASASAQYYLGNMYDNGQGVLQDYSKTVKWYRLSAKQGDADAQNNLGVMYRDALRARARQTIVRRSHRTGA